LGAGRGIAGAITWTGSRGLSRLGVVTQTIEELEDCSDNTLALGL